MAVGHTGRNRHRKSLGPTNEPRIVRFGRSYSSDVASLRSTPEACDAFYDVVLLAEGSTSLRPFGPGEDQCLSCRWAELMTRSGFGLRRWA